MTVITKFQWLKALNEAIPHMLRAISNGQPNVAKSFAEEVCYYYHKVYGR